MTSEFKFKLVHTTQQKHILGN